MSKKLGLGGLDPSRREVIIANPIPAYSRGILEFDVGDLDVSGKVLFLSGFLVD